MNYSAAGAFPPDTHTLHFDKTVTIKFAGITEPKVVAITGDLLDATAYEAYVKESGGKKASQTKTTMKTKTTKTGK